MIHYDGDRVFRASQVLEPLFKGSYDHNEFVIIDIMVSLGGSEYFLSNRRRGGDPHCHPSASAQHPRPQERHQSL